MEIWFCICVGVFGVFWQCYCCVGGKKWNGMGLNFSYECFIHQN